MEIKIETVIDAAIDDVWNAWTTPADIQNWNFATDDWVCPKAENNLAVGAQFNYRMEAKDGSTGFDFTGSYIHIKDKELIEYILTDDRKVKIYFLQTNDGIKVEEIFETEDENSGEQQKQGWQCILNNFKQYVENKYSNEQGGCL